MRTLAKCKDNWDIKWGVKFHQKMEVAKIEYKERKQRRKALNKQRYQINSNENKVNTIPFLKQKAYNQLIQKQ